MSAWHWQQVPPGLLTARPSQLGPEKSAHSSIYENVVWCTSDIDELFRFIYRPALRKMMPLFSSCHVLKAIRPPCGAVTQKHTHTNTHTHTCTHAHTFSVMMKIAEWCSFFFLCFLFFPYAYEYLNIGIIQCPQTKPASLGEPVTVAIVQRARPERRAIAP